MFRSIEVLPPTCSLPLPLNHRQKKCNKAILLNEKLPPKTMVVGKPHDWLWFLNFLGPTRWPTRQVAWMHGSYMTLGVSVICRFGKFKLKSPRSPSFKSIPPSFPRLHSATSNPFTAPVSQRYPVSSVLNLLDKPPALQPVAPWARFPPLRSSDRLTLHRSDHPKVTLPTGGNLRIDLNLSDSST